MEFDFSSDIPLFMQVAAQIEEGIFTGIFREGEQIPSTTEVSVQYQMNPATVLKGMNLLVDNGLIYKKRGVGMFVQHGARDKVAAQRSRSFFDDYILRLISEARKLNIGREQVIAMLERGFDDEA